jgi:hypothetical protein
MALHRDIFWIGRQWAVTGLGVQAIDQRLKGVFDIEASRLWEEDLVARTRAVSWLNADDFNKALDLARARYLEPPRKVLPLVDSVLDLMQPNSGETQTAAALREPPVPQVESAATEPLPQPIAQSLALKVARASARFLPLWRIRR